MFSTTTETLNCFTFLKSHQKGSFNHALSIKRYKFNHDMCEVNYLLNTVVVQTPPTAVYHWPPHYTSGHGSFCCHGLMLSGDHFVWFLQTNLRTFNKQYFNFMPYSYLYLFSSNVYCNVCLEQHSNPRLLIGTITKQWKKS